MSFYERLQETFCVTSEAESHPHVAGERAELYHCLDGCSTELEVLNFLHALVLLWKPERVLETGTYYGYGTIALADACRLNGFGSVTSLEVNQSYVDVARRNLRRLDLAADVVKQDSCAYLELCEDKFDFAFLDSGLETRVKEFEILQRTVLRRPGVIVIHDTSALRPSDAGNNLALRSGRGSLLPLAVDLGLLGHIECPYSRGLRVLVLK